MTQAYLDSATQAPQDTHPAFRWIKSQFIKSLNLEVQGYEHVKTGALHYHLASDSPENVFLVALRTVPTDSTGVAHMLEHTVLCGSEKYPVRDPFFMMLRRSLNTFMNAFTSSDWTAYPFASRNPKDFYNLLDVYLDAVFFSRIDPLDFAQEGHRMEFAESGNPDSELVFKGVVFNEMKGAMSSEVSVLWQQLTSHLYPTTTYHFNSGGEPENIPDLSYEELIAFYRKHYHPGNAVFMTCGDLPVNDIQQKLEINVLTRFSRSNEEITVQTERRFSSPVTVQEYYACDEESESKTHHVMGWLLGESADLKGQLEAHLLSNVLLNDSSSPLLYALETTGLGTAPSPLCGLEDSNREMCFVCGIEGADEDKAVAFEQMVLAVLQRVADEGVDQSRVEAVLHQLELTQREVRGDGFPYGLQLILAGLPGAIHRGDPINILNLDPVLEELRESIKNPKYIRALVQELLLDNVHRVRLSLLPDGKMNQRKQEAEAERLAQEKAKLSTDEKQKIIEFSKALAERQLQEDDKDILPKVGLEDVPAQIKIPVGISMTEYQAPLTYFAQGTNGLIYQQAIFELPELEQRLLDIMPYYTSCLTELGCGDRDYLETQAWQSAISGGIHAATQMRGRIDDEQCVRSHFLVSAKGLIRNHRAVSDLVFQTIEKARFDELDRIRNLVSQKRAAADQSITDQGHVLAMRAATSGMSPGAALINRLNGLTGIKQLRRLDDSLKDDEGVSRLARDFQELHNLVQSGSLQFLLIGEQEIQESAASSLMNRWYTAERSAEPNAKLFKLPPMREQVNQVWTTNTQVNFCAKAYPTVTANHPDAAALRVLGEFLRNGYLHRVVREQGGAYGAGASHDSGNAAFRFYSYRDPRLQDTLDDFDRTITWLLEGKHKTEQVEEAVLGVIGSIDKPGSPAGEAKQAFYNELYGRSREHQEKFRKAVLEISLADLQRVGERYLVPEKASIAVVTHEEMAARLEQKDSYQRHRL